MYIRANAGAQTLVRKHWCANTGAQTACHCLPFSHAHTPTLMLSLRLVFSSHTGCFPLPAATRATASRQVFYRVPPFSTLLSQLLLRFFVSRGRNRAAITKSVKNRAVTSINTCDNKECGKQSTDQHHQSSKILETSDCVRERESAVGREGQRGHALARGACALRRSPGTPAPWGLCSCQEAQEAQCQAQEAQCQIHHTPPAPLPPTVNLPWLSLCSNR